MKNKIALKLSLYFATALLVFAVIISTVFLMLFRENTIQLHKNDLKQRAVKISETLSTFMSSNNTGMGQGGMGGYGAYIRFLNDIAMADVWIVDEKLQLITPAQSMMHTQQYTYSELPADADKIVKEIFTGKTAFSESFSTLLATPTLTVGTPIKSADEKIIGVVLLHSPVKGINLAVNQGVVILAVSMGIALILAILLSIRFSVTFTRPLRRMNNTAIILPNHSSKVLFRLYILPTLPIA